MAQIGFAGRGREIDRVKTLAFLSLLKNSIYPVNALLSSGQSIGPGLDRATLGAWCQANRLARTRSGVH